MGNFTNSLSNDPFVQVLFYSGVLIVLGAILAYEPVYKFIGRSIKRIFMSNPEDTQDKEQQDRISAYERTHPGAKTQVSHAELSVPRFGVWQGFKFGFGFAIGFFVFIVLLFIAGMFFFGAIFSEMAKALSAASTFPIR